MIRFDSIHSDSSVCAKIYKCMLPDLKKIQNDLQPGKTKIFQDPRLLQTSGIFYSLSSLGENGEAT